MRTGGTFNVTSSSSTAPSSPAQPQRSPWHSPVPYLFGGLAAMLGLIAFALLILACSYWKLSGYLDEGGDNNGGNGDEESGNNSDDVVKAPQLQEYEPKILVIVPGEKKPTFLATPMSSRASSFGDTSRSSTSTQSEKSEKMEGEREREMTKQGSGDRVQSGNMETRETSDQDH